MVDLAVATQGTLPAAVTFAVTVRVRVNEFPLIVFADQPGGAVVAPGVAAGVALMPVRGVPVSVSTSGSPRPSAALYPVQVQTGVGAGADAGDKPRELRTALAPGGPATPDTLMLPLQAALPFSTSQTFVGAGSVVSVWAVVSWTQVAVSVSVSVAELVQLGLLVPGVSEAVTVVLGKANELLVAGPGDQVGGAPLVLPVAVPLKLLPVTSNFQWLARAGGDRQSVVVRTRLERANILYYIRCQPRTNGQKYIDLTSLARKDLRRQC